MQPHSSATAIGRGTARRFSSKHRAFQDRVWFIHKFHKDRIVGLNDDLRLFVRPERNT
ncbi:hypothetical protein DPMN_000951 [Dreissena polymorpha]|uniref:Uncharacterized protein n=1 Tax=Dreissena polymorpha TaxID=45954 RepID=A0A9D4RSH4_DREPO|nr:hypothetical protein DPMN_000951 [Dreissena polymorpha]